MKRILLAAAVSSAFAVAPVAFAEMGDAGNDAVVVAQAAQQRAPEGAADCIATAAGPRNFYAQRKEASAGAASATPA